MFPIFTTVWIGFFFSLSDSEQCEIFCVNMRTEVLENWLTACLKIFYLLSMEAERISVYHVFCSLFGVSGWTSRETSMGNFSLQQKIWKLAAAFSQQAATLAITKPFYGAIAWFCLAESGAENQFCKLFRAMHQEVISRCAAIERRLEGGKDATSSRNISRMHFLRKLAHECVIKGTALLYEHLHCSDFWWLFTGHLHK